MRNPIQSLQRAPQVSMHELVPSNLYTRLSRSLRLPSVAGNGLPERMRSTAFAFLGLTAALGLALVATFAQLSFPVLAPAPAPSGPQASAVSDAVSLNARPKGAAPVALESGGAEPRAGSAAAGGGDGVGGGGSEAGGVDAPAPAPAPSGEPSGTGGSAPEPAPAPAPQPSPQPTSEQPAPSTSRPDPVTPSKPEPTPARPAAPEPDPAPAPGNSQSGAAAEHASERGIEASAKPSTAAVAPEAAAEESPGNGSGKALGHSK